VVVEVGKKETRKILAEVRSWHGPPLHVTKEKGD
jgi:hypothetical protein